MAEFGTYNIRSGRNGGLESAFCRLAHGGGGGVILVY